MISLLVTLCSQQPLEPARMECEVPFSIVAPGRIAIVGLVEGRKSLMAIDTGSVRCYLAKPQVGNDPSKMPLYIFGTRAKSARFQIGSCSGIMQFYELKRNPLVFDK